MKRSLTLLDSSVIDLAAVDRITQSVVFFADTIAIRATYEVARRSDPVKVDHQIAMLRELGFLRFWAHEYEVDDAGFAGNPQQPGGSRRPADLIIGKSGLAQSIRAMDDVMRTIREEAYRDVLQGKRMLRQGVGEIIGLRGHLASLVISSELNQDGLLSNPATRIAIARGAQSDERFDSAVVREVLGQLKIGPLVELTPDQLLESRKFSDDFRKLFDESLVAVSHGIEPALTPEATARELALRYKAISSEYALPRIGDQIRGEVFWDVMGATLPPSIFLKYGIKAFKWRKESEKLKPYLLLMHLERSLAARDRG